jgi:hypothetical protein
MGHYFSKEFNSNEEIYYPLSKEMLGKERLIHKRNMSMRQSKLDK